MEIFVNKAEASVKEKKNRNQSSRVRGKKVRNRRKAKEDRRRSANGGVHVRLSTLKERRSARRRQHSDDEETNKSYSQIEENFLDSMDGHQEGKDSSEKQLDIIV